MRDTLFGGEPVARLGSERAAAGAASRPVWNSGQAMQQAQPGYGQTALWAGLRPRRYGGPGYGQGLWRAAVGGGGGSFLGTAAAAAAGVVGGSLLMNSIRGMMGGGISIRLSATPTRSATRSAVRGAAISPAARSRAMPASTTSAQPAVVPTTVSAPGFFDHGVERRQRQRRRHGHGLRRAISAATTAAAITPERCRSACQNENGRRSGGRFSFRDVECVTQITTTLVPTLTRP